MSSTTPRIVDVTLRDGSHPLGHALTATQVAEIAESLDQSGIDTVEVGHGFGLGASSLQFGVAGSSDDERLRAASAVLRHCRLGVMLLPGLGTSEDLRSAADSGAQVARIAVPCTEAALAGRHLELARALGLSAACFLMMAHLVHPSELVVQAQVGEEQGADTIMVVDSAGTMLPHEVEARVAALRTSLPLAIGFHSHNNLGMALANTLAAIRAGATIVDVSLLGLGAGAGNCQTEALVAVLERLDHATGIRLFDLVDAAQRLVRPLVPSGKLMLDRTNLCVGLGGLSTGLVLHVVEASWNYGVPLQDLLEQVGRRGLVEGQQEQVSLVAKELRASMTTSAEHEHERIGR